jgi:hypothetical protein
MIRFAQMGRLAVSALIAALALAAASTPSFASAATVVAGKPVSLSNGYGKAQISRRGSLLAVVGWGRIRIVDLPSGRAPVRSCNKPLRKVNASTWTARGRDVRCRVWGMGPWRVTLLGWRIHASGVVRGFLRLDGRDSGRTGTYKIGDAPRRAWPRYLATFRLGP